MLFKRVFGLWDSSLHQCPINTLKWIIALLDVSLKSEDSKSDEIKTQEAPKSIEDQFNVIKIILTVTSTQEAHASAL